LIYSQVQSSLRTDERRTDEIGEIHTRNSNTMSYLSNVEASRTVLLD
jgi:hypothetical protein